MGVDIPSGAKVARRPVGPSANMQICIKVRGHSVEEEEGQHFHSVESRVITH